MAARNRDLAGNQPVPPEAADPNMKALRNVLIAFQTTPLPLWGIAFGVLLFLFAKIYLFDSMPEIFARAFEVGRLAQNLGEATLAALLFFVFSYQLPYVIEQQRVGPTVIQLLGNVIHLAVQPLQRIYMEPVEGRTDGELHPEDVSEQMVARYFNKVAAANVSRWLESFSESDERCRQDIAQIWRYSRFIDSEILGLISQLELSEFSRTLHLVGRIRSFSPGASLGFLAMPYFWNFKIAMRLSVLAGELQRRYAMPTTFTPP
jgi:hypothetical protein